MPIDPRTATPCRTVAFSADAGVLAEANYLGFVTLRDAATGDLLRRFLAQTALVETVRFEAGTGHLLLVGAGFEGGRDCGVVKVIDPKSGRRLEELRAHGDDATDVISLPGERRRIVSVGLDRRVVVSDLEDPARTWTWSAYEDYVNTCADRPRHPEQFAVAGDSPYTYVLDADRRAVVARIDTPGDCNGLLWSDDGRYLVVGDDAGRLAYFDGEARWKPAGEARVGGAAKRMVVDPGAPRRALVAAYDGRVWSVPRSPDGSEPFVAIDRRRGMWGINVAATASRISVPTFFDRAYLLARDDRGRVIGDVGGEPGPTFGCNWIAPHPSREEVAVTHDDARVRVLDAATGKPLRTFGPDTDSLLMGAAWHPTQPWLATVDFYGEVLVYDERTGRVAWRRDMGFGPGIAVDFDPSGRWLAAGGYGWEARVLTLGPDGLPVATQVLDAPNRGVVKSLAFAGPDRLLVASGDGALVVHDRRGDRFVAVRTIRGTPPMELSNGVAASPDGRTAYVVSRDQSLRAFDIESGEARGVGLAHVRGAKSVHVSECGRHVATGAYDRTVLLWDAADLSVRLPPVRLANSGVSCVRYKRGRVFACSFDGVVSCTDGATGRLVWHRTAADASRDEGV
jgi:WD40 repeat protein